MSAEPWSEPWKVDSDPWNDPTPLHTKPYERDESTETGWGGFGFLSGQEVEDLVIPPIKYLVEELIPAGGITLLAGPPKACKSFGAIGVSVAVSAGFRHAFAAPTSPSPALSTVSALSAGGLPKAVNAHGAVLYLTPDDPNIGRFRSRVRQVNGGTVPLDLHVSPMQSPGVGATFADRLIGELDTRKVGESDDNPPVRLVVIDTLQRIKAPGVGGDRYADDVSALAQLRRVCVAHPDVSILALHHSRKSDPKRDGDPLELVSGTQGIAGGVDQVLVLQVPSDRGPARTMHVIGRDGQDHSLALTMTEAGLVLVDEDPHDPARLMSEVTARVYRAVREFPSGVAVRELAPMVGLDSKAASDVLRRLIASGQVIRLERGVYRSAEWTGDTA